MPILQTRLKNAVRKACAPLQMKDLEFYLHTITVNGDKRGCSGFIRNASNDAVVYVNTEQPVYSVLRDYMFRYADNIRDYTGYRNHWADTLEELSTGIAELLKTPVAEANEFRV